MKDRLELGPKGIRALVALCSHAMGNGNFAEDGRTLARVLIVTAGAEEDVRAWRAAELGTSLGRDSLRRLRESVEELGA